MIALKNKLSMQVLLSPTTIPIVGRSKALLNLYELERSCLNINFSKPSHKRFDYYNKNNKLKALNLKG